VQVTSLIAQKIRSFKSKRYGVPIVFCRKKDCIVKSRGNGGKISFQEMKGIQEPEVHD
jgi:hypothetical protein